jgi:hypothetical protein
MIQTGKSTGSLDIDSIRTLTWTFRARPGTYCDWHAAASDASSPCRASGRAYFLGSENCSTVMFSRSTCSGGSPWARSNGQIAAVSPGVNAPLAPINRPA